MGERLCVWSFSTLSLKQPVSFELHFVRQVIEAQLEAHRLLSSTAGARSGAARASRSGRRPAGPADFWVLEQHLSRRLCACATVLPHVAGFSAIVSRAPPVSGERDAPRASQATVQHLLRARQSAVSAEDPEQVESKGKTYTCTEITESTN